MRKLIDCHRFILRTLDDPTYLFMLFLPFFPVLKSKEVLPTSFLFLGLNDVVLTMSPNKRLETSRVSSLHLSEQGLG